MSEEIKITFRKPAALTTEMKDALAKCYAMPGFRSYLENMINSLIVISAMKSENMQELSEYRGSIRQAEKILSQSMACFYDYDKIKKMEKRLTESKK